jgi:hypothetical protein
MKKIKKIQELEEKIEYMGQDSEDDAVKYVQEVNKEWEEEEKKELDDSLNKLDMSSDLTYSQILVEEANGFMSNFDIPKGFTWGAMRTKEGICFYFRTPEGKYYAWGNKICLVPEYDMNGVVRKIFKMLDTMDSLVEDKDVPNKKIITKG